MSPTSPSIGAEDAVMAAVCYADIFDFSPRENELPTYAPFCVMDQATRSKSVATLVESGRLGREGKRLFLPGRHALAELRLERDTISEKRYGQLREQLPPLLSAPWIKAALLTGSLAAGNSEPDADADLFLVLDRRRMWIGYFIVRLWTRLKRDVEFCPNYCVGDDALSLLYPNIFTAIEWNMARPLKMAPVLKSMDRENAWHRTFIPNGFSLEAKQVVLPTTRSWLMRCLSWLVQSSLGGLLDRLEFKRLNWRTKGAYQVDGHIYKPHPPTRQYGILSRFMERLDAAKISAPALRAHLDEQMVLLKQDIERWGQPSEPEAGAQRLAKKLEPM